LVLLHRADGATPSFAKECRASARPLGGTTMTSRMLRSAGAAAALLASSLALNAAELARPAKAAFAAPPLHGWNGFYLRVNGGAGRGDGAPAPASAVFDAVFAAAAVPRAADGGAAWALQSRWSVTGAPLAYNFGGASVDRVAASAASATLSAKGRLARADATERF
jgi:hypothetical protein